MEVRSRYEQIERIVENRLGCSAHKLDHVYRVYDLCLLLSEGEEQVNMDVLLPAALLHDIARVDESNDSSGMIDHALLGGEMAEDILNAMGYDEETSKEIRHCIECHRYRTNRSPHSLEAKILFDADKLDILGAVGISRAFMIAGQYGQSLYDEHSLEDYINENTSFNGRLKDVKKHSPIFEYEMKLKRIPEKLYTEKGRKIAVRRLRFMKDFFDTLRLEVRGIA